MKQNEVPVTQIFQKEQKKKKTKRKTKGKAKAATQCTEEGFSETMMPPHSSPC